ncbi:phospholipase [Massilia forsythiae]|uniref:Phospholipase n=1 Tax=Massilia forsythiae TaxID=2728020 RepID=A0A7Z2W1R5_9BURK|nr:phospholipase D-like domain-containing protein [Massilia forsythiae]QJE02810.1 phospholipase [Massilia forsythiae]
MRAPLLLLSLGLLLARPALADFAARGVELVHTVPVETALATPDLRDPTVVWSELFDAANKEIVIAQFYAASQRGARFERVIERLAAAGARGVRIRFLLEERGKSISDPATVARLRRIPNLELRYLEYGKLSADGIIHAKYLVVDGKAAYLGSQNFDWRAFEHIHETGVRIDDATVAAQMQAIFDYDWRAQDLLAHGQSVAAPARTVASDAASATASAGARPDVYLVASPAAFTPGAVRDAEAELVRLLGQAREEVAVQLLDYAPLSYGPNHTRPYYAVIDDAVRAAAARGVKVKLMVSNWNTEEPAIHYLQSLAVLPNVEVRIVTLPPAAQGVIPFARVIHSKLMVVDGRTAWIGTSNWAGGYLDRSRNLELVLNDARFAARLLQLHRQTWDSPYAAPIDVVRRYPKPLKGG